MGRVTLAHPEFKHIRELWHPSKNGDLQPRDFSRRSHKRIWLQCPGCPNCGCRHEWRPQPHDLTKRKGPVYCPFCYNFGSFCPCKSIANDSRSVSSLDCLCQDKSPHGAISLPSSMDRTALTARSAWKPESTPKHR